MTPFETEIEGIVDSILEDYTHGRDIDRIDLFKHPDKDIIIDMIDKLRRIVFPGYFTEKTYRIYNAKHNLSMLIEDVMFNLNRQMLLVLQDAGVDTLILGCTHYPFTENAVRRVLGENITLFDGAVITAQTTKEALADRNLLHEGPGEVIFQNSLPGDRMLTLSRQLAGL